MPGVDEALALGSIGLSLWGSSKSASASRQAARDRRKAGAATAVNILLQSEETKRRMVESQSVSLGTAIARAAASGIEVNASALREIKYGIPDTAKPDSAQIRAESLQYIRDNPEPGSNNRWQRKTEAYNANILTSSRLNAATDEYLATPVERLAGGPVQDSLGAYVSRAKKTYAADIAWEDRFARSQAKAARLGGQVAYSAGMAEARATEIGGWANVAISTYSYGRQNKWWGD